MTQPLVLPADISGGGVLLLRYRNLLAEELGFIIETTVSTTAAHGEARRVVLADEFRDDEMGSELLPGGAAYLYVRTGTQAGSQRRFVSRSEAGYDGSRGMTMLSRPFDAPLAAGTIVEVTSPIPVKKHLGVKGLDDCVNEGLARCPVIVRLTLTGTGVNQHSLAAYPWLTHEDQILGLYDRWGANTGDALAASPYGFRLDGAGVARTLVTDYAYGATDTAELAVIVPGDRLIYDGSQWTYATDPGLHDENDRAAAPEHWVTAFAMVKALQFLERLVLRQGMDRESKLDAVAEIRSRRATWAQAARRIMLTEFPRPKQKMSPLVMGRTTTANDEWAETIQGRWW